MMVYAPYSHDNMVIVVPASVSGDKKLYQMIKGCVR